MKADYKLDAKGYGDGNRMRNTSFVDSFSLMSSIVPEGSARRVIGIVFLVLTVIFCINFQDICTYMVFVSVK